MDNETVIVDSVPGAEAVTEDSSALFRFIRHTLRREGLIDWHATMDHGTPGITTGWTFREFASAAGLVGSIAALAAEMKHHPLLIWDHLRVQVVLRTSATGGLTAADIDMARRLEILTGGERDA